MSEGLDLSNIVEVACAGAGLAPAPPLTAAPKTDAPTPDAPKPVAPPAPQAAPAGPPKVASPALSQKAHELVAVADQLRELGQKYEALKGEAFAAMKAEGVDDVPLSDRKHPLSIERGEETKNVSKGILQAHLKPEEVDKLWAAAKKPFERLSVPKPDVPDGP